jgi:hypothetical protein
MAEPVIPPRPPPRSGWQQWWKRTSAVILGAGAIAGAITAVVTLVAPTPDPENSVQVAAVRTVSQVPINEYRRRSAPVTATVSHRAFAAPLSRAAGDTLVSDPVRATAGPRQTASPGLTSRPAGTSSRSTPATRTTTSAAMPPSTTTSGGQVSTSHPSVDESSSPGPSDKPFQQQESVEIGNFDPPIPPEDKVASALAATTKTIRSERSFRCSPGCEDAMDTVVAAKCLSPDGKPVEPAVAAERVLQVLHDARTTQSTGEEPPEPLGVVVSSDVELIGLRGRPVTLSWEMWQTGGGVRLHGDWLNSNLAYRLQAVTDHDTVTTDMWVPLPKPPGPYFVRVDINSGNTRLASADSEPFD